MQIEKTANIIGGVNRICAEDKSPPEILAGSLRIPPK